MSMILTSGHVGRETANRDGVVEACAHGGMLSTVVILVASPTKPQHRDKV
jgi:hypothetical protein